MYNILLALFILLFIFCFTVTAAVIVVLVYIKHGGEVNLKYVEDDDADDDS